MMKGLFACLLVATLSVSDAFAPSLSLSRSTGALNMDMKYENKFAEVSKNMKAKFLPAVLGAGLCLMATGPVDPAHAARSGSRGGGSSFRMPRSSGGGGMRSSTAMRSSRGYGGGGVMPMPMMSPYGYSSFGFSPFGFMPVNLNVLVLGFIAYTVFNALANRTGGSDFSNDGTVGSLGGGATVLKLQISMTSDWSQKGNIMETLTRLAEKNNAMSGRSDLAKLLSESSMAILRRQNDWNSAAYEGELFSFGAQKAEPYFQRLTVQERAKFEEETTPDSVAMIKNSNEIVASLPTEMVVSIVVAMRGESSAYAKNVRSLADVSKCLQGLAADSLTDDGDNVMAVEILWTPSEPTTVISERELIEDYPELVKF